MVLWWIGNVVLLLVVVARAGRAAQPRARRARAHPRGVRRHPGRRRRGSLGELDGVPEAAGHDRPDHRTTSPPAPPATPAPSPSCCPRKEEPTHATRRLGDHRDRRADHRRRRARPAARDLPPRAVTATLDDVIGGVAVIAEQHQHRARGAAVGERQPQAGPRLLRGDLMGAVTPRWPTTGWASATRSAIVVVLVVVALVVPILAARPLDRQAGGRDRRPRSRDSVRQHRGPAAAEHDHRPRDRDHRRAPARPRRLGG